MPARQPVRPLPAVPVAVPVVVLCVPAVPEVLGVVCCVPGVLVLGVVCAGWLVLGLVFSVPGWLVLGVVVLGVDVWGDPVGLLCVWAGAELEGDVLFGLVLWATTQVPESSSTAISVAFDFIAGHASVFICVTAKNLGAILPQENPADPLSCPRRYRTAIFLVAREILPQAEFKDETRCSPLRDCSE